MRKLVLAAATPTALALFAVPAVSAPTHKCGHMGTAVGNIRAINTNCATARKVARADLQGKRYRGFRCTSKRYPAGASVTCRKGKKKVTFQVAD